MSCVRIHTYVCMFVCMSNTIMCKFIFPPSTYIDVYPFIVLVVTTEIQIPNRFALHALY